MFITSSNFNSSEINTILTYLAFLYPKDITRLFCHFMYQYPIENKEQICQRFNSEIEVIKMQILNYKNDIISIEILDVDKIISSDENSNGRNDEIHDFGDNNIGDGDDFHDNFFSFYN